MARTRRFSRFAALALFLVPGIGRAQYPRTWVSGVGNDANICSRSAPCKTFAGAISRTGSKGEIDVLDPCSAGGVTITQAITIDGGGFAAGVLGAVNNSMTIDAGAADVVVLRNLQFNGLGVGLNAIRILQAGLVVVDNVRIQGYKQFGISIEPTAQPVQVVVRNSSIENNGGASGGGIGVQPGVGVHAVLTVEGATLARNRTGLLVADRGKASVRSSVAAANIGFGFFARSTSAAAELILEESMAANNSGAGIRAEGSLAVVRISNVGTFDNNIGLATSSGGRIVSFGNNRNGGNATAGAPTSTVAQQ